MIAQAFRLGFRIEFDSDPERVTHVFLADSMHIDMGAFQALDEKLINTPRLEAWAVMCGPFRPEICTASANPIRTSFELYSVSGMRWRR